MEYEELIELVRTEDYAEIDYEYENGGSFQQCRNFGYNLAYVFDDLLEKFGRPPTCKEYVDEGMDRCKRFWTERTSREFGIAVFRKFHWNSSVLRNACVTRLIRTYKSKMVEYSTVCYLKTKTDVLVGEHSLIDLWLGTDIVVASPYYNVVTYLHVTTEKSNIMDKEGRGAGTWNGRKGFVRDFSRNHMTLAYANKKTNSTFYINCIPFLEPDYIDDVIESSFIDPIGEHDKMLGKNSFSEMKRLDTYIKEVIDPDGLKNVWLNKREVYQDFSQFTK